jgi:hypothetical protein
MCNVQCKMFKCLTLKYLNILHSFLFFSTTWTLIAERRPIEHCKLKILLLFQRCTLFIQLPQRRPIRAERIPRTEAIKQAIAQFLIPLVVAQSGNL